MKNLVLLFFAIQLLAACGTKEKVDLKKDQLTVMVSCGPNGNVSPLGKVLLNKGDIFAPTITPDMGFAIDIIEVDGKSVDLASIHNVISSDVTIIHNIFITFKKVITFTIETSCGSNGTVSSLGKSEVLKGIDLTIAITPNPGYEIDALIVDDAVVLTKSSYAFLNISSNHKLVVSFRKSQLGNLTQGPWRRCEVQYRHKGTTIWTNYFVPDITILTYAFDATFNLKVFDSKSILIGGYGYEIKADSLIWGGGMRQKIIHLTSDTLILRAESKNPDGTPSGTESQYTYTHP